MDTKTSQTHSPPLLSSRRKSNNECINSPEFEFWMLRNPSFPQPNILPADQLFHDGVILPLHLISTKNKPDRHQKPDSSSPAITSDSTTTTTTTSSSSKRWKDIFRKKHNNTEEKVKKKDKRVGNGGGVGAELNINLWPFSRSRSAGNSTTKPKSFTGAPVSRKVNSAPCSRSNSAGDSKSRKWPSSPGRAGVHLGRSSPVWQVRRGGCSATKNTSLSVSIKPADKSKRETTTSTRRSRLASTGAGGGSAKDKVLNLNVPMCIIGYSDSSEKENSVGGGKLFNLRTFFTKKTVLTSH
ncbi:unnamed protein product [Trifolium pratense]|uniref:Uncharacterized protein n=1 Tax=Trifolium pratense TaxID=57577 RepID=A0ACB0JWH6_TRIPR|nr:unnamed protein product [Trifolium pratense]